ncbi:XdhC/CoxI family protein [Rhizobium rhizosphaerae]|uniref:XdhC/CoxI family protein n=1 Tax=Xaviernesmea rhizosphaerae TaxID=1672749 RepID=A0A1Q9AG40_9HYPH|nr:XdhC family protein [Xaviernesmea rhizosphaerae]OLP53897.1 XdhC/CoxI family protein [Xaviernesmea rhizosphaerae]OQP88095.1 XdhC/CoxI family protein [Xaviernesmea rhizosphaerae]
MVSAWMEAGDPLVIAQRWAGEGRRVALATVIDTWGSAPRPRGSHLVVDQDGNFEGSVSGGCVESEVITQAIEVIETGGAGRLLEFGVSNETAWRAGLSCGGRISVFVQDVAH